MRAIYIIITGVLLAGCNGSTSNGWHRVSSTEQGQVERAKAICSGRASETQVSAGRYWIAGAFASNETFKGCMAEQGFVQ